jgi:hypothetical protein
MSNKFFVAKVRSFFEHALYITYFFLRTAPEAAHEFGCGPLPLKFGNQWHNFMWQQWLRYFDSKKENFLFKKPVA